MSLVHILLISIIQFSMMNYIWAGIIIFSFFFALLSGKMSSLSSGVLEGAAQAVNICLKLLGTLCLWNGISEIMKKAGIDKKLEKLLSLPVKLIFPRYSKTDAAGAITANIAANLLGLGNAATPLGIEAMRRMNNFNKSDTADNEIVRFVVINSAALTFFAHKYCCA